MEVSGNSLILYGNLAQKGMGCQGKSRGKPLFFKKLSPEDFLRFHQTIEVEIGHSLCAPCEGIHGKTGKTGRKPQHLADATRSRHLEIGGRSTRWMLSV